MVKYWFFLYFQYRATILYTFQHFPYTALHDLRTCAGKHTGNVPCTDFRI